MAMLFLSVELYSAPVVMNLSGVDFPSETPFPVNIKALLLLKE